MCVLDKIWQGPLENKEFGFVTPIGMKPEAKVIEIIVFRKVVFLVHLYFQLSNINS